MPQVVYLYVVLAAFALGFIQDFYTKYYDCEDDPTRQCARFIREYGCDGSPGYVAVFCANSCGICHLRNYTTRCNSHRLGYNNTDIWQPGSVSTLFNSIKHPKVVYSHDPYVVRIDNLFTKEEADIMIQLGHKYGGYHPSTDQGKTDPDTGVQQQTLSSYRTSSNAWCLAGDCEEEPIVKSVYERIYNITGIPFSNSESLQILNYKPGQYYKVHHDARQDEIKDLPGPRILTAFIYLNEDMEGGHTTFPELGVSVKPKLGSMVLWPSVTDRDPTRLDPRTAHQADPVIRGEKYGMNVWYHLRNFRIPNKHGCTGNFG